MEAVWLVFVWKFAVGEVGLGGVQREVRRVSSRMRSEAACWSRRMRVCWWPVLLGLGEGVVQRMNFLSSWEITFAEAREVLLSLIWLVGPELAK